MTSLHLEVINLTWASLGAWLVFVMGHYVYTQSRIGDGISRPSVQLAIGLAVLFLGEGGIRAWVGYARAAMRDGASAGWMFTSPWLVAFALVAVTGLVCVARVVSPASWGHARWGVPAGLAMGVAAWSLLTVQG